MLLFRATVSALHSLIGFCLKRYAILAMIAAPCVAAMARVGSGHARSLQGRIHATFPSNFPEQTDEVPSGFPRGSRDRGYWRNSLA